MCEVCIPLIASGHRNRERELCPSQGGSFYLTGEPFDENSIIGRNAHDFNGQLLSETEREREREIETKRV